MLLGQMHSNKAEFVWWWWMGVIGSPATFVLKIIWGCDKNKWLTF